MQYITPNSVVAEADRQERQIHTWTIHSYDNEALALPMESA